MTRTWVATKCESSNWQLVIGKQPTNQHRSAESQQTQKTGSALIKVAYYQKTESQLPASQPICDRE